MMIRALGCMGILCTWVLTAACDVKVGQNGVSVDIAHGTASDEWKRTYHLAPGGHLEIVNVLGLVTAEPTAGSDVEVVAAREARAGTEDAARALLAQAEMLERVSPDRVSIESRVPRGIGREIRVQITVRVPAGLDVSLKTEQGGVRLEGVEGTFAAQSTNGQIFGRAVSGSAQVSTVNGAVRMEFAKLTADSRVTTVNGPVELAVPSDVNATLEASVVNGNVQIADSLPLTTTDRTEQHVAGRINKGGPLLVAQTTNGRVRIKAGTLDTFEGLRGRGRGGRGGGQP